MRSIFHRCSLTLLGLVVACSSSGTGAPTTEPATTAVTQVAPATAQAAAPTTVPNAAPTTTGAKAAPTTAQSASATSAGLTSITVDSAPDKYFALYDKLMRQQATWVSQEVRPDPIFKVAAQVGMTRAQFDSCRENRGMIDALNGIKEIREMVDPILAGRIAASDGTAKAR